jgi:hypothetical protein
MSPGFRRKDSHSTLGPVRETAKVGARTDTSGDPYKKIRDLEELVHRPGGVLAHVLQDVGIPPEGHRRI